MDEIYDNLENFNEIISNEQLALENKDLRFCLAETKAELKQVRMEFDKLLIDHHQLLKNYSSLLKTARAEVERKTDIVTNINANKDDMFLRMLYDKTNMGKRWMKRRSKKVRGDTKRLKDDKKSGLAEKCDEKKTREAKHDHDQPEDRKFQNQEPKLKTEYRKPKLTKPKDEIVAKKETNNELKEERKLNDILNEKENKEKNVKAGSIIKRRKSMPVLRYEPEKFSSDEDQSTLTARSSSTKDETDTALNNGGKDYKNTLTEPLTNRETLISDIERSDPSRSRSPRVELKNSEQKKSTNMDDRNTDHREPSKNVDRHPAQRVSQRLNNRHSGQRDLQSMDNRRPDDRESRRMQNRHPDRESPRMEDIQYGHREPPRNDNRHSGQSEAQNIDDRPTDHREQRRIQNRHPDEESPRMDDLHSGYREPPNLDNRHSGQREPLDLDRHSDYREPPKDLRYKLKNYDRRDSRKTKERCPSREDKHRHRDYKDRSRERPHDYKDRHLDLRTHHSNSRQSRRDLHEHRASDRDRHRILESPPLDKYSRTKSRDRRSSHRLPDRRMEQEPNRQRPDNHHETHSLKPSTSDVPQVDAGDHPIDKPPEQGIEHKSHPAVSFATKFRATVCNEDGEPTSKRRRLESSPSEEGPSRHGREERHLEALSLHTCQSPDELMAETVQVDTPVKVITITDATGLADPRLTSKRYKQIIEKNNRIRLCTITGRNVELKTLPPYSTHIFKSQDPNNKFEEYTEEDLVQGIYMDFDDKDGNDTLESGEVDDSDLYSDLQIDDQPNKYMQEKEQSIPQVLPPLLLIAPLEPPQTSTKELSQSTTESSSVENADIEKCKELQESNKNLQQCSLENKAIENVQMKKPEDPHNSFTHKELDSNDKAKEDEHLYSGVMSKKFRRPKVKPTENPLENKETPKIKPTENSLENNETNSLKAGPVKPSAEAAPSNPLKFILRHLTSTSQLSSGLSASAYSTNTSSSYIQGDSLDPLAEQPKLDTAPEICPNNIKVSHPADTICRERCSTDDAIALNNNDSKGKLLTRRQIIEGDLELSDDDISDSIDPHDTEKEPAKKLTKTMEIKKRKSGSKETAENMKTVEKDQGKQTLKSAKFADLFGDSSSLITPEDLELLTQPPVELHSEFCPSVEDESAVHIDIADKEKLTESCKKTTKSLYKSSNKVKKDHTSGKKSSKRNKATQATEKIKMSKITHKQEKSKEVTSETDPNRVEILKVNPVVETEDDVVKTIVISTGIQQVLAETSTKDNNSITPKLQTSFKPFSQLDNEQLKALATSTPVRDVNVSLKNILPIADGNPNEGSQNISDDSASIQSVTLDSLSNSKEVDAPDVKLCFRGKKRNRSIKYVK